MNKKLGLYILTGIVLIAGLYTAISYNSFINKQEGVNKYWSDVQRTYQRRADLIPSLVQTVKGMANYEKETLEKITELRNRISTASLSTDASPESIALQEQLQQELAIHANRLIATVESYPNLRGTEGFLNLQTQMEGTERRIKVARQDYNQAVNEYNVRVRSFPSSMTAKLFGFTVKQPFAADAGTEKAIEIKFK
jgi:LemA protein